MAQFTITVDDPSGIDLRYFFPGTFSFFWVSPRHFDNVAGTADASYSEIVNGVTDSTTVYRTSWAGQPGTFSLVFIPNGGIQGVITSGALERSVSGGPFVQLAHMSVILGNTTGLSGGIPISASLDLTPDILLSYAFQFDADTANLTLLGAAGNDTLGGSDFNDTINGGGGSDLMSGRGGNDRYFVDRSTDVIVEAGGQGFDTVIATAHFVLQAGVSVETMRTLGSASTYNVNLTGNSMANTIQGNAGINRLGGGSNSDTLYGYDGNDVLTGGLNRDFMTGGSGADRFDFNSVAEIGKSTTRDVIRDFTHGTDHIDLATIDANSAVGGNQAFKFLASKGAAFTDTAGELRWLQQNVSGTSSDKTIIEGDVNGDGTADFQIQLTGLKTLTASDFFL